VAERTGVKELSSEEAWRGYREAGENTKVNGQGTSSDME